MKNYIDYTYIYIFEKFLDKHFFKSANSDISFYLYQTSTFLFFFFFNYRRKMGLNFLNFFFFFFFNTRDRMACNDWKFIIFFFMKVFNLCLRSWIAQITLKNFPFKYNCILGSKKNLPVPIQKNTKNDGPLRSVVWSKIARLSWFCIETLVYSWCVSIISEIQNSK